MATFSRHAGVRGLGFRTCAATLALMQKAPARRLRCRCECGAKLLEAAARKLAFWGLPATSEQRQRSDRADRRPEVDVDVGGAASSSRARGGAARAAMARARAAQNKTIFYNKKISRGIHCNICCDNIMNMLFLFPFVAAEKGYKISHLSTWLRTNWPFRTVLASTVVQ